MSKSALKGDSFSASLAEDLIGIAEHEVQRRTSALLSGLASAMTTTKPVRRGRPPGSKNKKHGRK